MLMLLLVGCGEAPKGSVEEPVLVSEHYEGVAAFAVQSPRFPCEEMLESVEGLESPGLAFPYGTFGDSGECVAKFVKRSELKPHLLHVYVTNETCREYNFCAEGDLFLNFSAEELSRRLEERDVETLATFRRRISDISDFISRVASRNTRVVIVTGLEDEYTPQAAKVVYALVREKFGEVVENPLHPRVLAGEILEVHGDDDAPPGGIASEDGVCRSDEETRHFLRVNKGTLASFVWRAEWQGRECRDGRTTGPSIPPREREFVYDSGISRVWD